MRYNKPLKGGVLLFHGFLGDGLGRRSSRLARQLSWKLFLK
jgi:hypothetical protein